MQKGSTTFAFRKLHTRDTHNVFNNRVMIRLMIALPHLVLSSLQDSFRSLEELKAENTLLRHQANVLRRQYPGKVRLRSANRFLLVYPYKLFPALLRAIMIVKPETVISWHRAWYRAWWRWKSRMRVGRPRIDSGRAYRAVADFLPKVFGRVSWSALPRVPNAAAELRRRPKHYIGGCAHPSCG
jgi:hypothetical protein